MANLDPDNIKVRIASFLNDVKSQLAKKEWVMISSVDLCKIHGIDNMSLLYLVQMKCIERSEHRITPKGHQSQHRYGSASSYMYRRLEALNELTVDTFLKFAKDKRAVANKISRDKRYEREAREAQEALEAQRIQVGEVNKPNQLPSETPVVPLAKEGVNTIQPGKPAPGFAHTVISPQAFMVSCNGVLHHEEFTTIRACENYIVARVQQGESWRILGLVDVVEAKVSLVSKYVGV